MSMNLDKAIARVRKYLQLATSSNEHEAAQAAARASALMAEYNLSEAMLRVEDTSRAAEKITEGTLDEQHKHQKRVAWKAAIASAVATGYGAKTWWHGANLTAFGRESAVQAWSYTSAYLFRQVDELADKRWLAEKDAAEAVGQNARKWKNAFRVGAASTIATRLYEEQRKAKAAKRDRARTPAPAGSYAEVRDRIVAEAHESQGIGEELFGATEAAPAHTPEQEKLALELIDRDEREVETAYAEVSKGFRATKSIGHTSCRSGYHAGREAGATVALGGGRAGLPAGQGRLK